MTRNNKRNPKELKQETYTNADLVGGYFRDHDHKLPQILKQFYDVTVEIYPKHDAISLQGDEKGVASALNFLEQIADEASAGALITASYITTAAENFVEKAPAASKAANNNRPQARKGKRQNRNKSKDDGLSQNFNKGSHSIVLKDYKFQPRNDEQSELYNAYDSAKLIVAHGEAGTGKTHVSVAKAIDLYERGIISKIIIARPAVEAGEKLGFIPGTKEDKIAPYMQPVYDEFDQIIGKEKRRELMSQGKIEAVPLAFLRGRTLTDSFVVVDEAQNTTLTQLEMILTRAGENSWFSVEGDVHQTDLDIPKEKTGLAEALELFRDKPYAKVLELKEVVRSELAKNCVNAFKTHRDKKNAPNLPHKTKQNKI